MNNHNIEQYFGLWCINGMYKYFIEQFINISLGKDAHSIESLVSSRMESSSSQNARQKNIALVPAVGVITRYPSFFGTSSLVIQQELQMAREDPSVAGVFMPIDSPGGIALGMHQVSQEVKKTAEVKPVIASSNGVMASAAYHLGAHATEIHGTSDAMFGSLGTFALVVDTSKMFEQIGIDVTFITTAPKKGLNVDGVEQTPDMIDSLKSNVEDINNLFMNDVKTGRNIDDSQLQKVNQGDVFIAKRAKDLGLVDRIVNSQSESLTFMSRSKKIHDNRRKRSEHISRLRERMKQYASNY